MNIKNPQTGQDLNLDSRLIPTHLKRKLLTPKDHESYLKSLKDVSDKIKPFDPPPEEHSPENLSAEVD